MEHVSKIYFMGEQRIAALSDVSFCIEQGEFVVILGPSGAGKSTVLNILGGMDYVEQGRVLVGGENIGAYDEAKLTKYRAREVGFVFQFYNLIPALTVYENVNLVREITPQSISVEEVLKAVGLWERRNLFPTQISGGEQQRVSIARALCKNPSLLLCDEPTGALDSETGREVTALLLEMCRSKKQTVVVVSHNAAFAQISDRVIHLKNGKVESVKTNAVPADVSEVVW